MITQSELKENLKYNPDTGVFIWLASRGSVRRGRSARSLDNEGYITICINGRAYKGHRLAWLYVYGVWPKYQIDHISRIRDDNRIANLRDVPISTNLKNSSLSKRNTSGVTGVYFIKKDGTWAARICVKSKLLHLATFKDKFEAICCRKSANNKYGFHPNHGK